MCHRLIFVLLSISSVLYGAEPKRDVPVAVVAGTVITEEELDAYAGSEVYALKEQLHQARKRALRSLINSRLLASAARNHGIPAQVYARSLVPHDVVVSEQELVEAVALMAESRGNMPADEFEQRVRLDLEACRRLEAYDQAINRLRADAGVVVSLQEPVSPDFVRAADGPSRGAGPVAPVTIVEFSDFQCPFCRQAAPMLEALTAKYKDRVRVVFKHFPLPNHPRATPAAKAAICAGEQGKFWPYHDRLFSGSDLSDAALRDYGRQVGLELASFERCISSEATNKILRADAEQARRLQVSATPTLFVNGKAVRAGDIEAVSAVIDEELATESAGATAGK